MKNYLKEIKHKIYIKYFVKGNGKVTGEFFPPGHYYSTIPNLNEVKENEESIFSTREEIIGIDLNETEQLSLLNKFREFYAELSFPAHKDKNFRFYYENEAYSYSDSIFLFCMIRSLNPKKIIEVGSGFSTCAMLDINERFYGNKISLTCIEPYPDLLLSLLPAGDRNKFFLEKKKLQSIAIEKFRKLEKNDILFIDSTHVSKINSDVNYAIHEILPILKRGVYIHFHDIFFPFEYPKEWVYGGRSWNEAYMLRAFLEFNSHYKIIMFNTFLEYKHKQFFENHMPLCLKNTGGSIWIKKVN